MGVLTGGVETERCVQWFRAARAGKQSAGTSGRDDGTGDFGGATAQLGPDEYSARPGDTNELVRGGLVALQLLEPSRDVLVVGLDLVGLAQDADGFVRLAELQQDLRRDGRERPHHPSSYSTARRICTSASSLRPSLNNTQPRLSRYAPFFGSSLTAFWIRPSASSRFVPFSAHM